MVSPVALEDFSSLSSPSKSLRIAEFVTGAPGREQEKLGIMDTVKKLVTCEKPIIGAINGVASGDGAQWMLAFDLNVASKGARFSWPATQLGLL